MYSKERLHEIKKAYVRYLTDEFIDKLKNGKDEDDE